MTERRVDNDPVDDAVGALSAELICVVEDGRIARINAAGASMLGTSGGAVSPVVGRSFREFVITDDRELVSDLEAEGGRQEINLQRPDGSTVLVDLACTGRGDSRVFVGRDLSGVQSLVRAAMSHESNLRRMMNAVCDGVLVVDPDGKVVVANNAIRDMFGLDRDEMLGRYVRSLLRRDTPLASDDDGQQDWFARLRGQGWRFTGIRGDGEEFPVEVSVSEFASERGGQGGLIAIFRDVTFQDEATARLEFLATQDPLTGLPNRNRFEEELTDAMRTGEAFAVYFVDLDQFQNINDAFGHEVGDFVLLEAGSRLAQLVDGQGRGRCVVSRAGGDEFHLIVPSIDTVKEAEDVAGQIMAAVSRPFVCDGQNVFTTASVGVALFPDHATSERELLRVVEIATNTAKREGRASSRVYRQELADRVYRRVSVAHALRSALERDEFHLVYQPKVRLVSGAVEGAEALLRWDSEALGRVSPDEFIGVAEEVGLMAPIGEWVLATACREAAEWPITAAGPLRVGVNLSAIQFHQSDVAKIVRDSLEAASLSAQALDVELTESILVDRFDETVRAIMEIKESGTTVSMDDFGTGYSSLSYLTKLPLDALKIDRAFVQGLGVDAHSVDVINAIVGLAKSLSLSVVAEGIETLEHVSLLRWLDCDIGQGYHFAKPLTTDQFQQYLKAS